MAEVFGVVAGAAQLYGSIASVIRLALELRDELIKGPRRIRDNIKCLDSTISVLRSVDCGTCSPQNKIHSYVCAVDAKIRALRDILRSHLQSLSHGPFRRLVGALTTIKAAEKINGEFKALDREKANLHLYISIQSDKKLQRLIVRHHMDSGRNRSAPASGRESRTYANVASGLNSSSSLVTTGRNRTVALNSTHADQPCQTPSGRVAQGRHESDADYESRFGVSRTTTMTTTTSTARTDSWTAVDQGSPSDTFSASRQHSTHNSQGAREDPPDGKWTDHEGHQVKSQDTFEKEAEHRIGDDVESTSPQYQSNKHKVESNDKYKGKVNYRVGNNIRIT